MKSLIAPVLLLLAVGVGASDPRLAGRAACNADNCARAVTGTNAKPALTSRRADCSSFFATTVTPATSTSTVTVTPAPATAFTTTQGAVRTITSTTSTVVDFVDTDSTAAGQRAKRAATASPSAVPTYASACSGTSRYSSACSCAGVTHSTTTAPTPVTTVTVTAPPRTQGGVFTTTTSTTVVDVVATYTTGPGPRPSNGTTVQANGPCGCQYVVNQNQAYSGGSIITTEMGIGEMDCINLCDSYENCNDADYLRTNGQCRIFERGTGYTPTPSEDTIAYQGSICNDNGGDACASQAPTQTVMR